MINNNVSLLLLEVVSGWLSAVCVSVTGSVAAFRSFRRSKFMKKNQSKQGFFA